jgi:hypothetical protein
MARHACPLGEEFSHVRPDTPVERLLDQHIGHGGVMAVDIDMGIKIDTGLFPRGICRRLERERPECRPLEHRTQRLA